MVRRVAVLLMVIPAALVAAAGGGGSTVAVPRGGAATTVPATASSQPADYYALSADAFFKLPAATGRIRKNQADISLLEAAIFHQTNTERTANKLPAFQYSMAMNLMARRHSGEMAELQFFDHTSPTPANRTLADRLRNVSLTNVTAGENIAVLPAREIGSGRYVTHDPLDGNEVWYDEVTGKRMDYFTYQALAEAVVAKWKNSPPHWKNILDPQFKFLGVGAARGEYDKEKQDSFYMTQNFCSTVQAASEAKAKPLLAPKTP